MRENKNYYSVSFGIYLGVIVNEKLMRKATKLLRKQDEELKQLLLNNLDDLEVNNWTLAHPNGEEQAINYISKNNYETKEERIDVISKIQSVTKIDHLYRCEEKEAIEEHMELFDDDYIVSNQNI